MAGHYNYRPTVPVQIASIDTLIARGLRPPADLIIIDEAHMAISKGYREVLEAYPDAYIVSVTATPWVNTGLSHVAESVVHPISMLELIELGFLAPFRYFAPSEPDLTGVKVSRSTKDYETESLAQAMEGSKLTGRVIDHWRKIAGNLPTLCFAVNVRHSRMLAQKFRDEGIAAEHCDADCTDRERADTIERLERGETKVICNVGIFCTGVDIPCVGAVIMARPTKSRNLFIQQAGRGTRPFPGKPNCILLDHAGNIHRHGLPTDEPDVDLEGFDDEKTPRESKICKSCFCVYRGPKCPECGIEPPEAPEIKITESDDQLQELKNIEVDPIRREYKRLLLEARKSGRKQAWAMHRLVQRYSFEKAAPYLPDWFKRTFGARPVAFAGSPFKGVENRTINDLDL